MTSDLLTWISIGIIYSSWTIYLLSLKFMRWGVVELLDALKLFSGATNGQTNIPTCAKQYAPSFFWRGGGINMVYQVKIHTFVSINYNNCKTFYLIQHNSEPDSETYPLDIYLYIDFPWVNKRSGGGEVLLKKAVGLQSKGSRVRNLVLPLWFSEIGYQLLLSCNMTQRLLKRCKIPPKQTTPDKQCNTLHIHGYKAWTLRTIERYRQETKFFPFYTSLFGFKEKVLL